MSGIGNNVPVYIMPFLAKSLLVYHSLKGDVSIAGFIDNDITKIGRMYDDTIICSPQDAFFVNPHAHIILCEMKYYTEMEEQLIKTGFTKITYFHNLQYKDTPDDILPLFDRDTFILLTEDGDARLSGLCCAVKGLSWQSLFELLEVQNTRPYVFTALCEQDVSVLDKKKLLICINATTTFNDDYFNQCLQSIYAQSYKLFDVLIISTLRDISKIKNNSSFRSHVNLKIINCNVSLSNYELVGFISETYSQLYLSDYILTINSNDIFSNNAFSTVIKTISNERAVLLTSNEDRIYNGEYIAPYYKNDYINDLYIRDAKLLRNLIIIKSNQTDVLFSDYARNEMFVIPHILYHYRIIDGQQNDNQIKPIAFYLPQFHPIPENDLWWGEGFTEWTNVKRAHPMFPGHYQPHEPGYLGYYDLVSDEDIQHKQIELAKKHGIYGFCYYYYWFNGKRLLEKPIDRLLEDKSLDFPFCICWANENWTKRWDGMDNEILLEQVHNEVSDSKFILDVIPLFYDPRYIKIDGAPLLMIYRADILPDLGKTVAIWREICLQNGINKLHISCAQTFDFLYNDKLGVNSVAQFPPHKHANLERLNDKITDLDPNFCGKIFDYRLYAATAMHNRKRKYLRFMGIMLGWDNTARRLNNSDIFINSSPEEYKKWLITLVDFVSRYSEEERLIFINAWNEWAEGTHLEPEVKYGNAFLEATQAAIGINV